MLLVIGNRNYSSWSLRPWLAMKVLGLAFDEVRIPLYRPGSKEQILRYSPARHDFKGKQAGAARVHQTMEWL